MKSFKSTAQLIDLLSSERGLEIGDRDEAIAFFRNTNYYRFTGYSRYFQLDPVQGENSYRAGTTLTEIANLIHRDDELRMQLFGVLAEVEMSIRTRFAHLTGRLLGAHAFYLQPANYISSSPETSKRIVGLRKELQSTSSRMVMHYRAGEDLSQVPIWVAVEVLSFGKLSWMVESLKASEIRESLASFYGHPAATFPRVLHSLSALRNACAHHSQLWHRNLTIQCPQPLNKRERPRDISYHEHSIYPAILALKKLAKSAASRETLSVLESSLRDRSTYSTGLLLPQGVR